MKYFKDYQTFLSEKSDYGFSVLDIFKPFTGLFKNINVKYKLNNIINDYDHYLYIVYKEYLNRKYKVDKSLDIDVVSDDHKIHNIETETETDHESDSDKKPNDLGSTKTDEEKIKDIFGDVDPNFYFLCEELLELIENNQTIILNKMLNDTRAKLESNSIKLQEEKNKNKEYIKMVRRYMNTMSSLDADTKLDAIKKRQEKEYTKKMLDSTNIKLNNSNNEIKRFEANIEETEINIDLIKKAILYASKNVNPNPPNPDKDYSYTVKEAKTWNEGSVYDIEWTAKDMESINKLINPYQIQEHFLKAEYILDNLDTDDDRNGKTEKKYKNYWEQLVTKLHKKWYFTYDVKNLKSVSLSDINKSKSKEEITDKKELIYYSLVLEELFKDIKTYSSPFKKLITDKNKYFIMLNNTSMFLMKKIIFDQEKNQYSFQIICDLKSTKDGKLILGDLLNTATNRMKLNIIPNISVDVYKESNSYPIVFIKDGYIYSGLNINDLKKYDLKKTNIYSLKDYNIEKIKKDSNKNFNEVLDEKMYDKIKNIII